MKKPKPVVRRATLEDLKEVWPGEVIPSGKFWLGEIEGEIVAVGGLARSSVGRWQLFCDLSDPAREYPIHLARMGKRVMDDWNRTGRKTLFAVQDKEEPTANRWLLSLGFEQQSDTLWRYDRKEA
jgi:N-acetylglutamate synthase-like GNAT family acetyltransferase